MTLHQLSEFKNKRVFLTGHTGFKGSWMSIWLNQLGAKVKGYALAAPSISLYSDIEKSIEIESEISDIRDSEKLKNSILSFEPDYIFHMAAQPLVLYSYENPIETFEVNTLGTAYLLDSLRSLKKKCSVVVVTTDKVYENHEWVYPYRETDKLGGYDPYSASKAAAEIVASSYRSSFFNPKEFSKHNKAIATARAGNVIGGGDFAENRLVPDIIRALKNQKEVIVRNPNSIRPWQHVLEPIAGYLLLALALNRDEKTFASSFNFGPQSEDFASVAQLVSRSISVWGSGTFKVESNSNSPHEAGLLKLDINKAQQELNWKPKWDSETGIRKTISWYKNYYEKTAGASSLCLQDIKDYSTENK